MKDHPNWNSLSLSDISLHQNQGSGSRFHSDSRIKRLIPVGVGIRSCLLVGYEIAFSYHLEKKKFLISFVRFFFSFPDGITTQIPYKIRILRHEFAYYEKELGISLSLSYVQWKLGMTQVSTAALSWMLFSFPNLLFAYMRELYLVHVIWPFARIPKRVGDSLFPDPHQQDSTRVKPSPATCLTCHPYK